MHSAAVTDDPLNRLRLRAPRYGPSSMRETTTEQPTTAHGLADTLRKLVTDKIDLLVTDHLRGWRLPATFGGHPVGPDVAADLAYTLGHLHDTDVDEVAGTPLVDAVVRVLDQVDGARTHTFFSYRVAETLLRFGPSFDGNPILTGLSSDQVDQIRLACDSSDWISLLGESFLPRNYAGVLARCESARARLGLLDADGEAVVEDLIGRARDVLAANHLHFLDDSNSGIGRFDIYTADVWLFTRPFEEQLGHLWTDGMAAALDLVERVMSDNGTAVAWGRSTGPLATALTIELGALVAARAGDAGHGSDRQLGDSPSRWLTRASLAADAMTDWFDKGVVNAHQHRDADGYRGPFRRLQLTLDLLGKLAWAANRLYEAPSDLTAAPLIEVLPPTDDLVRFDTDRPAGVWSHRGAGSPGFVIPFVGSSRSDYLAAPRSPGCYEVPSDSELACWVASLFRGDRRATPSGLPTHLEHRENGVTARWDEFTYGAELEPSPDAHTAEAKATVDYDAHGRTIEARWRIEATKAPDAIVVLIPERADRPLNVQTSVAEGTRALVDMSDVSGIAEWRSHWSAFSALHEIEVIPTVHADGSAKTDVTVSVTPKIRVSSTAFGHHYDRSLYRPLAAHVQETACPWGPLGDASQDPSTIDLLHLHRPEWLAFDDLSAHQTIAAELDRRRIPVVWTAHNLTPHEKRPDAYEPIYQLWADSAAAIIHHSHTGMDRFRNRYRSSPSTRHVVIPHGHFGDLWADHAPSGGTDGVDRDAAAAELGLEPCALRIGMLGAPRAEKLVGEFLRGVAASSRTDIQVACWSIGADDDVPDDLRIVIADRYDLADPSVYAMRLAACDVLAMPFDPDGDMLATGTVFDAIGLAMPVLRSDWGFLVEVLGDAGIPMGHTASAIAASLDALDIDTVAAAGRAAVMRRDELTWDTIAARTLTLFEEVLADC